jgi:predicted dehydrogenase
MALSVAECERMLAAARAKDVTLGVAYYRHLYPAVRRLRELLASGELGKPMLAFAHAFELFDPPPGHPRAWLLKKSESGGGPMMDFGCHRIEILLDLLGPVTDVRGFPSKLRFPEREVEDTCLAQLRFASGALAMLTVSHAVRQPKDSFEIHGSEGTLSIPVLNQGRMRVVSAAGEREESHPPHANLHLPIVEDFVAAVREGRAPAVPGECGLAVNRTLAAIYG